MNSKKFAIMAGALAVGALLVIPKIANANPTPQQQYQAVLEEKPEIKKFEKAPDFTLGQLVTKEQLNKKGFYLDKEGADNVKFQFYLSVNDHEKIFGVQVARKIYVVEDMKVIGLISEIENEKTLNDLKAALITEFGRPKDDMQRNVDIATAWGVTLDKPQPGMSEKSKKNNNLIPLVLTYNIYHQKGALVWTAPSNLFKKK